MLAIVMNFQTFSPLSCTMTMKSIGLARCRRSLRYVLKCTETGDPFIGSGIQNVKGFACLYRAHPKHVVFICNIITQEQSRKKFLCVSLIFIQRDSRRIAFNNKEDSSPSRPLCIHGWQHFFQWSQRECFVGQTYGCPVGNKSWKKCLEILSLGALSTMSGFVTIALHNMPMKQD